MVTSRDPLKDLLHSRHNLPCCHCGEEIKFSLSSRDKLPFMILLLFLKLCCFNSVWSPKRPEGSLSFQFNVMFAGSPDRSTLPFGTKISKPAELKTAETENKNFPSESLGVIVSGTIPMSDP